MKSNYNFKNVSNFIVQNTYRCIVFQFLFLLNINIVLADTVIHKCTYERGNYIHENVIVTKVEKDEKGPKSVQYYYWDGKRLVAEYSFRITYTDGTGCYLIIQMSDGKDRQKLLHNLLTKGQTAGIKLYSGAELTLSCLTLGYVIEQGYQLFLGRIPDGDEAINLVINNQTKYISFKDIFVLRHDSKGNVELKLISGISLTGVLGSPPYQHLVPIIKGITKNGEFKSLLFSEVQEINFEKVDRQIGPFPTAVNEKSAKGQPKNGSLSIRFQNDTIVTSKSWYFMYSCITPLQDNPRRGVESTRQSRALRILIDGRERVIPDGQLTSMQFEWKAGAPDYIIRQPARLFLTTGETIAAWNWHAEDCGGAELVLPPEGLRQEWLRIDFWRSVGGLASSFRDEDRVIEIFFRGGVSR